MREISPQRHKEPLRHRENPRAMFLIVGLGNPGDDYAHTRHNLGFMLVEKLAAEEGISVKRRECQSLIGSGVIEAERVKLIKPQTYMNLSREAVRWWTSKYELQE